MVIHLLTTFLQIHSKNYCLLLKQYRPTFKAQNMPFLADREIWGHETLKTPFWLFIKKQIFLWNIGLYFIATQTILQYRISLLDRRSFKDMFRFLKILFIYWFVFYFIKSNINVKSLLLIVYFIKLIIKNSGIPN